MADEPATLTGSIDDFFSRCDLDPRARLDCDAFLEKHFPGRPIRPAQTQGYCSYTVSVDHRIVQFRPSRYKLDLDVANAARYVYGTYAPETAFLGTLEPHGLHIYTMEKVQGISYKDFTTQQHPDAAKIRKALCEDFAVVLAKAWHNRTKAHLPLGTIGSSIKQRLEHLNTDLPPRFRPAVAHVLSQYHHLHSLPTVLAHGDIVPSNILLDPRTGHLFGLVDWAEAETLPFGICLYGLEEILGHITPKKQFLYYPDAEQARAAFWAKLHAEIPELADEQIFNALLLARELGILLWHGFAFDDGAINRVVQEGRDWQEICYLDTLLGQGGGRTPGLDRVP
jgi:hypothetical protein